MCQLLEDIITEKFATNGCKYPKQIAKVLVRLIGNSALTLLQSDFSQLAHRAEYTHEVLLAAHLLRNKRVHFIYQKRIKAYIKEFGVVPLITQ